MDIQALASSSRGNCYRIDDKHTVLLLECGLPIAALRKALRFRIREIAGCLVTHGHQDHCRAAGDLMRAGIDCYMSQGTADALGLSGHRLHIVGAGMRFEIGSWSVLPFPTIHDAPEPLGFLLASGSEKLLFATDTAYLDALRFRGLTHIMLEANYSETILRQRCEDGEPTALAQRNRLLFSHMSVESLCRWLPENDLSALQEVWLLHASNGNANAEEMGRRVEEIVGCPVRIA